jgi:hypothetical protein
MRQKGTGISLANRYVWEFNTMQLALGSIVNLGSARRFGILSECWVSNAGFSEIRNMDIWNKLVFVLVYWIPTCNCVSRRVPLMI